MYYVRLPRVWWNESIGVLFCRRVVINSESEMPTNYGTTPGGTMFAHTPGGTRIVYERAFLMQMRQSPLAKSPPANLPLIPGVTVPSQSSPDSKSSSAAADSQQKLQTVKGISNAGFSLCVYLFSSKRKILACPRAQSQASTNATRCHEYLQGLGRLLAVPGVLVSFFKALF